MEEEQYLQTEETNPLNTPNFVTGICQHCGEQEGDYCINPFLSDVHNVQEWEYICSSCYSQLVYEI